MRATKEVVYFNYTVKDSTGHPIDSSQGKTVAILQGAKQTFQVVEDSILKAPIGEKKIIKVKCTDAYGAYKESLVKQVEESKFKNKPKIGSRFKVKTPKGILEMTVVDNKDGVYILDGNHSLAGLDLIFEIEVTKRRPAQEFELKTGQVKPSI